MLKVKVLLATALLAICLGFKPVSSFTLNATEPPQFLEVISNAVQGPLMCNSTSATLLRGICYVSEARTAALSARINSLIEILPTEENRLQISGDEPQVRTNGNLQDLKQVCSEERIQAIEQDLTQVLVQIWNLGNRLQNVSQPDVDKIDKKKTNLIQRLWELRVYTGNSLTENSMMLHTFEVQVDYLEYSLNTALAMFQTPRPPRPPVSIARTSVSSPVSYTKPASEIPQLIATKYFGRLSNFDSTLQYIQRLSSVDQKIIGSDALFDQMRSNSQLDTYELTKLAYHVKQLQASASSASSATRATMASLAAKIGPIYKLVGGTSRCAIKSVAYGRDLVASVPTDDGWPKFAALYKADSGYSGKTQVSAVAGTPMVQFVSPLSNFNYIWGAKPDTHTQELRYVFQWPESIVAGPSFHWKLIPQNGGTNFKIRNFVGDELLFVHSSDKHATDYRLAYLAVAGKTPSFSDNADLWTFNCT